MDIRFYLQFAVAILGLLGGLFAYILGLRIRHDILENNERLDKEITAVKENATAAVTSLRNELIKEFANNLLRHAEDFNATLADKILHTVNGKYIRTEFYNQGFSNIQERFSTMKELIEDNMEKIEHGLDRQIIDLKERIFHDK